MLLQGLTTPQHTKVTVGICEAHKSWDPSLCLSCLFLTISKRRWKFHVYFQNSNMFFRRQTIYCVVSIYTFLTTQRCRKKFSLIFAKWLYTTNFCFIFSISTNVLPPTNLFFANLFIFAEYLLQKCLV